MSYLHWRMSPSVRLEITILCFTMQESAETLRNALRHTGWKRRFVFYERYQFAVLFFTIYGWKLKVFSFFFSFYKKKIISVLCVYDKTGVVEISAVFLSLSSETNARTRQDLYNSKQYRFCPHTLLQSTQNESSFERL